jgi:hypothetical protein
MLYISFINQAKFMIYLNGDRYLGLIGRAVAAANLIAASKVKTDRPGAGLHVYLVLHIYFHIRLRKLISLLSKYETRVMIDN